MVELSKTENFSGYDTTINVIGGLSEEKNL